VTVPRAVFLPREFAVAGFVAVLAQASFVALFLLPPPPAVIADVSDDNAKPIAVSITPVALLKKGDKNPGRLPASWQRAKAPPPSAAATKDQGKNSLPSTKADPAGAPPALLPDAGFLRPVDSANPQGADAPGLSGSATPTGSATSGPMSASSVLGAANGSADGTETDPLKARAADMYRAQLASWFASRFQIRGKVPFDTLKTLSASVVVQVSPERRVTGFSLSRPSGNAEFDEEVRGTLTRIQSSGTELPAPPPAYPEILARQVPVSFRCTARSQCE